MNLEARDSVRRHRAQAPLIDRVDRYLRREDTILAHVAAWFSPDVPENSEFPGHYYLGSHRKRWLVDVPFGIAGTAITAIPIAVFGTAVWLEDHGPIFYLDERMGPHGETIQVRKIRSMRLGADKISPEEVDRINLSVGPGDDPRNTRVGRVMRRFEIDEMPQFWQVLKGEFSMNGIRVMKQSFRDSMAKSVDPGDMEKWDAAYDRGPGIYNPNASRTKHRKDDKKRIHDDLLYDRRASLGFDFYLQTVTDLRMIGMFRTWATARSYAPLKDVVVDDIPFQIAVLTHQEWNFAKHFINELALETALLERMKAEGENGHFLDIGASIGIYSSLALRNGMSVTAFEPDPQSFGRLMANTEINAQRRGQVQLIDVALSDETGSAALFSDGIEHGCPSLRRTLDQSTFVEVPTFTLDELILNGLIDRPTFIKIDVEGAEMNVLRGGAQYFSSPEAADIFIEVHPDFLPLFDSSAEEVIGTLTDEFGYTLVSSMHKQNEVVMSFSKRG
ncbi:hypothetical protein A3D80_01990 [Candidatus Roizmanbacteria bacterium RIFCSPHIGHO2_02_FULL_40_13b]|uniref:Methyltransferase FkbM domain-containing protein n=1 Tax=Candidatus Roizmanbacteria bacterium RIFCSPHIGHO2_01_FULL_39_24 TaxID=1802032 RepID=A0A1F7GL65_9BACT|nr:MAG: hypothetical protein A2799_01350 [Candidatus Roizmanbacteria bacterium RIFCSPHIGHO2_01_FULL_39_24]OGK26897.1 MAG: hypothetical protein A3D80_01990 [Candidatus Roizmanbacteria bacterium RIFCSPHIGHO2_02_FULL_40_13b]OGK49470.1 MAG: hypothetical protein A3A56_03645 [Candidatus Roizmanbacteria bacterium RIFCSPLOWO2_01_FULL_40_32]